MGPSWLFLVATRGIKMHEEILSPYNNTDNEVVTKDDADQDLQHESQRSDQASDWKEQKRSGQRPTPGLEPGSESMVPPWLTYSSPAESTSAAAMPHPTSNQLEGTNRCG